MVGVGPPPSRVEAVRVLAKATVGGKAIRYVDPGPFPGARGR